MVKTIEIKCEHWYFVQPNQDPRPPKVSGLTNCYFKIWLFAIAEKKDIIKVRLKIPKVKKENLWKLQISQPRII